MQIKKLFKLVFRKLLYKLSAQITGGLQTNMKPKKKKQMNFLFSFFFIDHSRGCMQNLNYYFNERMSFFFVYRKNKYYFCLI